MIVDFMGRISSVEFMARMDDYYENIRPYFHFLTFDKVLTSSSTIRFCCPSIKPMRKMRKGVYKRQGEIFDPL